MLNQLHLSPTLSLEDHHAPILAQRPSPSLNSHPYQRIPLGCPCPAISILINHSYITVRESDDPIPFYSLIKGLVGCFNLSYFNAILLTFLANLICGNGWSVTIAQLGVHAKIEHDASLTRYDFGQGDFHNPSRDRTEAFLKSASSPDRVTLLDYARRRVMVESQTEARRPMTRRARLTSLGEVGLTLSVFGNHSLLDNGRGPGVRADWLHTIFLEERLPKDWSPPVRPVTIFQVCRLAQALRRSMEQIQRDTL